MNVRKGFSQAAAGLLLFFSVSLLGAAESGEYLSLIGLSLEDAFVRLGNPDRVFTLRGETPDQDDVVFFYQGFCYLFWADQRVWQVRFDENSNLTWGGDRPRILPAGFIPCSGGSLF